MAITVVMNKIYRKSEARLREFVCSWATAAASSTVSAYIGDYLYDLGRIDAAKITGRIVSIETIPGQDGNQASTPPETNYDVYLYDDYSCDLADANCVNRSSAVSELAAFVTPLTINTDLRLLVDNAGNARQGVVTILVED